LAEPVAVCIEEPRYQLSSRVDGELAMETPQVRHNGTEGHPEKLSGLAFSIAQYEALKNLLLSL
jgi:hypothetical protein